MYMDPSQAPNSYSDMLRSKEIAMQQSQSYAVGATAAPPTPPSLVEFTDCIANRLSEQRGMIERIENLLFGPCPAGGGSREIPPGALGVLEVLNDAIVNHNSRLEVICRRLGAQ